MNGVADNPLLSYFIANGGVGIHKWVDYFEVYHRALSKFRGRPIKFLEIGMQNGGSAKMWRHYFGAQAHIIGIDVDPACKALESDDLEVWIGDQASPEFWEELLEDHPDIDVVLDDGGHTMQQQLVSFYTLFPRLKDGGVYLCEDTHTSYFPAHGGGVGVKETFHEHMKALVDGMHAWYFAPLGDLQKEYWASNLYSLSFFDSIVVAEKRVKNPPVALARGQGHVNNPFAMTFLDMRRAFGVKDE